MAQVDGYGHTVSSAEGIGVKHPAPALGAAATRFSHSGIDRVLAISQDYFVVCEFKALATRSLNMVIREFR